MMNTDLAKTIKLSSSNNMKTRKLNDNHSSTNILSKKDELIEKLQYNLYQVNKQYKNMIDIYTNKFIKNNIPIEEIGFNIDTFHKK